MENISVCNFCIFCIGSCYIVVNTHVPYLNQWEEQVGSHVNMMRQIKSGSQLSGSLQIALLLSDGEH